MSVVFIYIVRNFRTDILTTKTVVILKIRTVLMLKLVCGMWQKTTRYKYTETYALFSSALFSMILM